MCGIACFITNSNALSKNDFITNIDRLRYRGPDSSGVYFSDDRKVALGHTRLSIIDLSNDANQPFHSDCGNLILIFNGEIYNFVELKAALAEDGVIFRTASDTEVLLAGFKLFGIKFFRKLNGPFAAIVYNVKDNVLSIARDRSGEKPLYYKQSKLGISFSSDLIVASKLHGASEISPQALHSYFVHGYALEDQAMLSGVESVPAGTYMTVDCSRLELHTEPFISNTICPPKVDKAFRKSVSDKMDMLLETAVRKQLRSDVPLALMLSGGVDSSLITAYASRSQKSLNTFTVTFPGHSDFDEAKSAELIAKKFNTNHVEINCRSISPDVLVSLVKNLDTPIIDSSLLPTFSLYREVGKQYKVALGGDGADELFGGYKHYSRYLKLSNISRAAELVLKIASSVPAFKLHQQRKLFNWSRLLTASRTGSISNLRTYTTEDELSDLLSDFSTQHLRGVLKSWWHQGVTNTNNYSMNEDFVDKLMAADYNTYLRNSILVKSDRCSMMNGVEARAPFLDINVVDFAQNTLSSQYKVSSADRKIILKDLCRKNLPKDFNIKRKLGFNLPFSSLLRTEEWQSFTQLVMCRPLNFLSLEARKKILADHYSGTDNGSLIFGLLTLILWAETNEIEI